MRTKGNRQFNWTPHRNRTTPKVSLCLIFSRLLVKEYQSVNGVFDSLLSGRLIVSSVSGCMHISFLALYAQYPCTATELIPTIEMISATEMIPNHHRNDPNHRNDTYSQSKWSRHKFSEPWLKWTWDFAIHSKFFVYLCKHDSKQRKIEKAIRLITVLYTDFIFKILTFF